MDAADEHGARRGSRHRVRRRCRTRCCPASAPATSSCSPAACSCSPPTRSPRTRKDLGYDSRRGGGRAAVTATFTGAELEGVEYDRIWDVYADTETWGTENAWRILVADYVATGEGTGIVHQAPAYGEDDQLVCAAAGIPVIISVDDDGRFLPMFDELGVAGLQVFEANKPLVQRLRADGRLCASRATSTATRTAGAAATR